jgi:hypothetical protein
MITAADAERLRKNFVASLGDRALGERMLGEPGVPTPPAPPSTLGISDSRSTSLPRP